MSKTESENEEKQDLGNLANWGFVNWGVDLNVCDPSTGFTALMGASMVSNTHTMKTLIERGADIHFRDPIKARTAVMIASKYCQLESLEVLCHFGADLYSQDIDGTTALIHAAKGGHMSIVIAICSKSTRGINFVDKIGNSAIHYAAKYGYKDVIDYLADIGAIIDGHDFRSGKTPIILAGEYGRKECIKTLVERGADINSCSSVDNITALMMSSKEGHKGTVLAILELNGNVNIHDIYGFTALHYAAVWGRRETAGLLLSVGKANPNFQCRARINTKSSSKKKSIKRQSNDEIGNNDGSFMEVSDYDARSGGRDIGCIDSGGNTPLMLAAKVGQFDLMTLLLDYGAKINIKSLVNGMSALAMAIDINLLESAMYLLDFGANVNSQDHEGRTPMMIATAAGKFDAMVILLNFFADLNIKDNMSQNVVTIAKKWKTLDLFYSSVYTSTALAKANLIPWIEDTLSRFIPSEKVTGPDYFIKGLLYGLDGLYVGLLKRPETCDAYLVQSLVMLATSFTRASACFPQDKKELDIRVQEVEYMLIECMKSHAMLNDQNFGNSFLLPKKGFSPGSLRPQLVLHAFASGPLGLSIHHQLVKMLWFPSIEQQMQSVFMCCQRDAGKAFFGVNGHSSPLLRLRYVPVLKFILEGFSKLTILLLIILVSRDESTTNQLFSPYYIADLSCFYEAAIVIYTFCFVLYELGLMEEKLNLLPTSSSFHYDELSRYRQLSCIHHFGQDVWKMFDMVSIGVLIYFSLDKIYYSSLFVDYDVLNFINSSSSSRNAKLILSLCAIPITFGLMRYPSTLIKSFGEFILSVFIQTADLFYMLILFLFTGLGFGIAFGGVYNSSDDFDGFLTSHSSFVALFDMIFLNYDLISYNSSTLGSVIAIVFIIWTVAILLNMIIARIVVNSEDVKMQARREWILIKAKTVSQFINVYESSPLCMLPPPFNIIPAAFYVPHMLHIFVTKIFMVTCLNNRIHCLSLAGTICDKIMYILFLVPAAFVEYFALFGKARYSTATITKMCFGPLTILFNVACLLMKFFLDTPTRLLLQSRARIGRLRISYDSSRDAILCIGMREFGSLPQIPVVKPSKPKGNRIKQVVTKKYVSSKVSAISNKIYMLSTKSDDNYGAVEYEGEEKNIVGMDDNSLKLLEKSLEDHSIDDGSSNISYDDQSLISIISEGSYQKEKASIDPTSIPAYRDSLIMPRKLRKQEPTSLDFPTNRGYEKIYTRLDQNRIFKHVLPEYFQDEYTRALKDNNLKLDTIDANISRRIETLEQKQDDQFRDVTQLLVILLSRIAIDHNTSTSQISIKNSSVRSQITSLEAKEEELKEE